MTTIEHVYNVIYDIVAAKKRARLAPIYAIFKSDILPRLPNYTAAEAKAAIEELIRCGRIMCGKTQQLKPWFAPKLK